MRWRKGVQSDITVFSELLRLRAWLTLCFSSQPSSRGGCLWLMGSTASLGPLLQTFHSITGDGVMPSRLRFGNAYFTNMKHMDIRTCFSIAGSACWIYSYRFAFSCIATFAVAPSSMLS